MNLFDILKQFKNIEPDPAYKESAKRAILAQTPHEPWSARRTVLTFFETSIAVALAGFFVLVITGTFPPASYVAPAQFSVIDPATLRAEAQAVDMEIQLAQITYTEATTSAESTLQAATDSVPTSSAAVLKALQAATSSSVAPAPSTTTSSTPSSTLSIDAALRELTQ